MHIKPCNTHSLSFSDFFAPKDSVYKYFFTAQEGTVLENNAYYLAQPCGRE